MAAQRGKSKIRYVLIGIVILGLVYVCVSLLEPLRKRSAWSRALGNAKQIQLALTDYAIDNDGLFPIAAGDSNSAYRQLFSGQFTDEDLFYVPGSAWHSSLPSGTEGPDGNIGEAPDYFEALMQGENHWAYANGLNNSSNGDLPIVMDGLTKSDGTYSRDFTKKGGVHGEKPIVIRIDGSGIMVDVSEDGTLKPDVFSETDPAILYNPW
jgi:hypothetical protein